VMLATMVAVVCEAADKTLGARRRKENEPPRRQDAKGS
jgi:hypothetical protein